MTIGVGSATVAETCDSGSAVLPGLNIDGCGESFPPSLLPSVSIC